jgi:hypothetical protein
MNMEKNHMHTTITWLLGDDNPAVKFRTLTELLGKTRNSAETEQAHKELLSSKLFASAMALFEISKDYADAYALSALAECGLTCNDGDIDRYAERLITNTQFHDGCGEGFLLRNLLALGYDGHPAIQAELPVFLATQQSDGGFPCVSKNPKIKQPNVPHKSCFQMTASCLLLTSEMRKLGLKCPQMVGIIKYFLGHEVLYRRDAPDVIVKPEMGSTFHPPVATRIGVHMLLWALARLGAGTAPSCNRAWELLESKKTADGSYMLDGTLAKPYLPKERVGKQSKWVTFYALLAKKERETK